MPGPFENMEARRGQVEAQRENTARLAKSFARWVTTGRGEIQVDSVFFFTCTFIAPPLFTSGFEIDESTPLKDGRFPRVNAGVWQWKQDTRGFYTGAWVYFTVDSLGPGQDYLRDDPLYKINHHLCFEGIALKDIPAYLLDF
jgi:hypothetical protein